MNDQSKLSWSKTIKERREIQEMKDRAKRQRIEQIVTIGIAAGITLLLIATCYQVLAKPMAEVAKVLA